VQAIAAGVWIAKASRGSGNKPKNDVPSYAVGKYWEKSRGEGLKQAIDRVMLGQQIGVKGTGPTSDYNQIKKYLGQRAR
ncbi:hypothetical protein, partial [Frigoribacterium sp. CFBP 13707]|uniref:hypothetical protein n=1 Tax=Frigoribacterium sp. CFBP 13707 TaxID=2775313 RepID=UPI001A7EC4E3